VNGQNTLDLNKVKQRIRELAQEAAQARNDWAIREKQIEAIKVALSATGNVEEAVRLMAEGFEECQVCCTEVHVVRNCEFPGCRRTAVEAVDCGPDEGGNERIYWFCERHRHTEVRTNELEFALGVLREIREQVGDRIPASWLDGLEAIMRRKLCGIVW